ncbi:enoyl-CoA hydratase/isomerase family protein [Streptomyces sp. NPDC056817]|uniref:enoyl-CoA hydratase/isomerase family protein n=1 Tax=Streptomyces sp. NPDC056817 TaxID=3345950 RepID=UPI0036D14B62
MLAEQMDAVSHLPSLRTVLVRGTGDTFCSDSDITERIGAEPDTVEHCFHWTEQAFRAVERCPNPVVAQIQGTAAGAGCRLALACDLRVMAGSARIGMPTARLGILPSPGFAARPVRLAGPVLARQFPYTGQLPPAAEAVTAGLANLCVPDAGLNDDVAALLADIASQPSTALRAAKRAVAEAAGEPSGRHLGPAVSYADLQRGIALFFG